MNNKIRDKAKHLGFCCEFAMLTAYSLKTRDWTRKKTKLSERTVQYSYAKMKEGKIACCGVEKQAECMIAKQKKEK